MLGFLGKLLDSNEKEIKRVLPTVEKTNALEPEMKKLSDEELKAKTSEFKLRFERGETLDDLLPEAFAAVREASRRTVGMRHFDVQLIGGIVLHEGKISEMKTGEGKTLVATLPLYLNALTGRGGHLVTVNDYLASRDAEWMGPIYHALGISVGVINHEKSYLFDPEAESKKEEIEKNQETSEKEAATPEQEGLGIGKFLREVSRKEAYLADVTYGTNNEFGFDYLRDNMVWDLSQMAQREHYFSIVDEVDSILIDEARTPLIISAPAEESTERYYDFANLAEKLQDKTDYSVDEKLKTVNLTEIGISKIERMLGVENLYEKDFETVHHVEEALKAKTLFKKDRDYVVKDGEVIIVDEFTGRLMFGRRYSEGLHQAIEAKESVPVQKESKTLATITFQNYFRMYEKLAGMTGTAATEAEEFHKIYKLDVVTIPTHQPMIRKDHSDFVYKNERGKYEAIVKEIIERHEKGQPILVGTTSIEKNELLSELLKRKGIPHAVLNAKHHEKEAQILSLAGQKGAVTVATNMAGRGVDIKLSEGVTDLGGLHVIGTERHEARRIDNQLRGRSGRQGDPGSSRFYVSLQDDIMRLFGGDQVAKLMDMFNLPEDVPIEHGMVSKSIESAQTRVEGHNFDIRKHVVEYDDIMNKQREIIYRLRRQILEESSQEASKKSHSELVSESESVKEDSGQAVTEETSQQDLKGRILDKINQEITNLVALHAAEGITEPEYETLISEFCGVIPFDETSQKQLLEQFKTTGDPEKITELLSKIARDLYESREKQLGYEVARQIEKVVALQVIDTLWMEHLDDIDDLRQGIGLRGYGQRDPLVEYKAEAFNMFERLMANIDYEIVHRIYKVQVQPAQSQSTQMVETKAEDEKPLPSPIEKPRGEENQIRKLLSQERRSLGIENRAEPALVSSTQPKVGRNDPCPCGSGLKYKKCHGK
ncbi:MAG: preprotein translocase subunit SecA [Patescibacteria group bacterium]|nr:preprotein translocase subunit SecA [Patescibacteria group bacterium]